MSGCYNDPIQGQTSTPVEVELDTGTLTDSSLDSYVDLDSSTLEVELTDARPWDATPRDTRGETEEATWTDIRWPDVPEVPESNETDCLNGFVLVSSGTFTIGSSENELGHVPSEEEQQITLTRDFCMQETEVTQEQFLNLMGFNPSRYSDCGPFCPVEGVNWFQAIEYANAFSTFHDLPECYSSNGLSTFSASVYDCPGYRLPTEVEWERAARGFEEPEVNWATWILDIPNNPTFKNSCSLDFVNPGFGLTSYQVRVLNSIAFWCRNSRRETQPVASLERNPWGIYDILGNVCEYTYDYYSRSTNSPEFTTDPIGHIGFLFFQARMRGGNIFSDLVTLRAASLECPTDTSSETSPVVGFRLVRTAPN
jgi:formylglycine-generating enzyme required for sulfatase activity